MRQERDHRYQLLLAELIVEEFDLGVGHRMRGPHHLAGEADGRQLAGASCFPLLPDEGAQFAGAHPRLAQIALGKGPGGGTTILIGGRPAHHAAQLRVEAVPRTVHRVQFDHPGGGPGQDAGEHACPGRQ